MHGVAGKYVTDGEDTYDQRAVKTTHGCNEKNNTVNGVYLRVLETFDMCRASPTHLLEEPAEESGGRISRGERGGVEGYFPVVKKKVGGQMTVFVDYCLDTNGGLGIPGE